MTNEANKPVTPEDEKAIHRAFVRISRLSKTPGMAIGVPPLATRDEIEDRTKDILAGRLRRIPAWESKSILGLLRYQFLIECQKLGIDESRWQHLRLDDPSGAPISFCPPTFRPPVFDVLHDSVEEWLARAERDWRQHSRKFASDCLHKIKIFEKNGVLITLRRARGRGKASPLARRLAWAALHCGAGWSYGKIANNKKHNPEEKSERTIITAAKRIISDLQLEQG